MISKAFVSANFLHCIVNVYIPYADHRRIARQHIDALATQAGLTRKEIAEARRGAKRMPRHAPLPPEAYTHCFLK